MKKISIQAVLSAVILSGCACAVFAEDTAGPGMPCFGFGMIEILLLSLLLFIPWLIAIVDIVKAEFKGNDKLIMFLLVLAVPVIGMIIYFTVGKKMKISGKS